jgi:hypothetical protein
MPTADELREAWAGAPVRLEVGANLRRPWCHNRPPYMPNGGEWLPRQGMHESIRYMLGLDAPRSRWRWTGQRWELASTGKPRYRWRRWFSTDACQAWSSSPTETPAPVRDRYDCRGCRHMPARAWHHFHPEES